MGVNPAVGKVLDCRSVARRRILSCCAARHSANPEEYQLSQRCEILVDIGDYFGRLSGLSTGWQPSSNRK